MKEYRNKPTTEQQLIDKVMKHWGEQIVKDPQTDILVNNIIEDFAQSCGIIQSKLDGDVFITVSNMTNRQKRLLYRILVEAQKAREMREIDA